MIHAVEFYTRDNNLHYLFRPSFFSRVRAVRYSFGVVLLFSAAMLALLPACGGNDHSLTMETPSQPTPALDLVACLTEYSVAIDAAKEGQYRRAIDGYTGVIDCLPLAEHADVYFRRGSAYARQAVEAKGTAKGQELYDRAIGDIGEAIRHDPENSRYYFSRGSWYGVLGQLERAIEDFDEGIRLDPFEPLGWAARAIAYQRLGKPKEAERDFQKAQALRDKSN